MLVSVLLNQSVGALVGPEIFSLACWQGCALVRLHFLSMFSMKEHNYLSMYFLKQFFTFVLQRMENAET